MQSNDGPQVNGGADQLTGDPLVGAVIDERYEITRRIGQGAMGTVYEVRHLQLGKRFAMKLVRRSLAQVPQFVELFKREAFSCSRLSHPNCVNVTDFNQTEDENLYMVMDYIDGQTLKQLIEERPMPLALALETTRQILLGLQHAHKSGIVHQDIKLENVIKVRRHDGHWQVKILDFGMARALTKDAVEKRIFGKGIAMGTPQYMAPEQLSDQKIDARTDLYAVGVVLWRLITGRLVFEQEDLREMLRAKVMNPAPTLSQVAPGTFPESLEALVTKALERQPEDRFGSAEEMLYALAKVERETRNHSIYPVGILVKKNLAHLGHLARTPKGKVAFTLIGLIFFWGILILAKKNFWGQDQTPAGTGVMVFEPGELSGSGSTGPGEVDPKTSDRLLQIQVLLNEKKYPKAKDELNALLGEHPKVARAHCLLGRALVSLGECEPGLLAYQQAFELDEQYRSDSRILDDVRKLTNRPECRTAALDFLFEQIGKPALPTLITIASRHPNRKLRHRAIDHVRQLGAIEHVDLAAGLELDLLQTKDCRKKAEIVDELAQVGDPKAIAVLRRARDAKLEDGFLLLGYRHDCVRPQIIRVIRQMSTAKRRDTDSATDIKAPANQ